MGQQLSEEELRAYVAQLREAPVAELFAQAFNLFGGWAEAKLGRFDARPLIDALSAIVQQAETLLPADLARQMKDGIGALQLAQVQAEQQLAARGGAESAAPPETGPSPSADATAPPADASQAEPAARPDGGSQQRLTDRLWIPGRDPKPPRR